MIQLIHFIPGLVDYLIQSGYLLIFPIYNLSITRPRMSYSLVTCGIA